MKRRAVFGGVWFWVSLALSGLLVVQSYLSYKFPIKQDLFGHMYRGYQMDRMIAYWYLLKSGRKFAHYDPDQINEIIESSAREYGVDPDLIRAITLYESYYQFTAISTTGAMGLMALMPATAREQGVRDPFDPRDNIAGGTRQVKMLSDAFKGDTALVLAGYNSGIANVMKNNRVPKIPEAVAYVANVQRIYKHLKEDSQIAGY